MKFYDLSGADNKRFSPFGWRVRMSLAHLDMEEHTEVELVKFSQKDKIRFSGQELVPVIPVSYTHLTLPTKRIV